MRASHSTIYRQSWPGRTPTLIGGLALAAAGVVVASVVGAGADIPVMALENSVPAATADDDRVATTVQGDAGGELATEPIVTYEVFLSRDPFEPVVPEDEEPAATGEVDPVTGEAITDPDATVGGGTDPSIAPPTDTGTTPLEGCRGDGEVVCEGRVVTLVDLATTLDGASVAVVQIDTVIYEVGVGERFAGAFEVRSIDGRCANLIYGDDGFQLCRGDAVLK